MTRALWFLLGCYVVHRMAVRIAHALHARASLFAACERERTNAAHALQLHHDTIKRHERAMRKAA